MKTTLLPLWLLFLAVTTVASQCRKYDRKQRRALKRQGWKRIWYDRFDKKLIKRNKWRHEVNCAGGGNFEEQCYTDRPENAYTSNGFLHIVARQETWQGPAVDDDHPDYDPQDTSVRQDFTSARLRTKDTFSFRYGRVDIRAKLASGQGTWPALWMLPTDNVYGEWPSSGEIDIVEAVNLESGGGPSLIESALHYGLPWPQWKVNFETLELEDRCNAADGFHVYSIEWEETEIRWYFDGNHIHTQQASGWYNYIWQGQDAGFAAASPTAPFDQKFHLILNLAVGGQKPGSPDVSNWTVRNDGTRIAEMLVDYIHVYQCTIPNPSGGKKRIISEDGSGCSNRDETVAVNADMGAPGNNAYTLFSLEDGATTLSLAAGNNGVVTNTLVPGLYESSPGNVVPTIEDSGEGFVWAITFRGLGSVFLTSDAMADDPSIEQGVTLVGGSGWTINGELTFEMRIIRNDNPSQNNFFVKMDSTYPNVGQVNIQTPPADDEWHRVAVRVSELLAHPIEGGTGIDVNNVLNLFVLEYTGENNGDEVKVEVRDIELNCAFNVFPEEWQLDQLCGMQARVKETGPQGPELVVYNANGYGDWNGDGAVDFNINLSDWGANITEVVFEGQLALKFMFDSLSESNAVVYFASLQGDLDLTAWNGGAVEFAMYVEADPRNTQSWAMKAECGWPCGSGDVPLDDSEEAVAPPPLGAWQNYTFPVERLLQGNGEVGLNLTKVSVPLALFPTWLNQDGVVYYVRNVKWIQAAVY
eukprot:scaffold6073_cov169-Amphora_coffeaeformis.AAC.4